MKRNLTFHSGAFVLFAIVACTQKDAYQKLVKQELAKGIRKDSLFLGFYFGMPQEDFYERCRVLNRKDILHQGAFAPSVDYELKDLKHAARLNFYPAFYRGKISQLPASISYDAWAPWNKQLSADSLLPDVLRYYEKKYDKPFLRVKSNSGPDVYLTIDGNRCLSVFKKDDVAVNVLFTDLTVTDPFAKK